MLRYERAIREAITDVCYGTLAIVYDPDPDLDLSVFIRGALYIYTKRAPLIAVAIGDSHTRVPWPGRAFLRGTPVRNTAFGSCRGAK